MSTFDFEEYRLPWETGPHWELKKEFMEQYKDNFPKDRLLCLAQAYSNMELLDCTYPDAVMQEVSDLAKSLHVCKRFREASRKKEMENSSNKKKRGKRKLSPEKTDKKCFIKFCPATPDEKSNVLPDLNTSSIDLDSCIATNEEESAAKMDSTETTNDNDIDKGFSKGKYFILNITQSPDFLEIKTLANDIKGVTGSPIGKLDKAISKFGIDKVRFEFKSPFETPVRLCYFYVGDTLICIGKENNERSARIRAGNYALEILSNLENLPCMTLDDLKSYWAKQDESFLSFHTNCCKDNDLVPDSKNIRFWLNFAKKVVEKFENSEINYSILEDTADELNISIFPCVFSEDLDCPINNHLYYCDLVIEKTIISQAIGTSKKMAKREALMSGLACIVDLINWYEESILKSNVNYIPDFIIPEVRYKASDIMMEIQNNLKSKQSLNQKLDPRSTQISSGSGVNVVSTNSEEKSEYPASVRFNHWLFQNSMKRQLVVCDASETCPNQNPATILSQTAGLCRKYQTYNVERITSPSNKLLYRCSVLFDKEVMGIGESSGKRQAKLIAVNNTLASLRKSVYTIKVKKESCKDKDNEIKRCDINDVQVSSNCIPDDNVGCKLLKKMGWSGGAIGNKEGGLIEPIIPSGAHRFHKGLGFTQKAKKEESLFKRKIDELLKDFSQSRSTKDLIFSADFSKEERQSIHLIADRYKLVSTSKGKGDDRRLFIRRKMSIPELLSLLLQAGGATSKYELWDCSM